MPFLVSNEQKHEVIRDTVHVFSVITANFGAVDDRPVHPILSTFQNKDSSYT